MQKATANGKANDQHVLKNLQQRLSQDAYAPFKDDLSNSVGAERMQAQLLEHAANRIQCTYHQSHPDFVQTTLGRFTSPSSSSSSSRVRRTTAKVNPLPTVDIPANLGVLFPDNIHLYLNHAVRRIRQFVDPNNWEFVILRPNIEHYMLGIILGQSGDSLGNTLWGQTELSVYDDAQHGVWGMSYKYHERAIVFNEKNLIRLWDIAYDGYNGGKDDTFVDWTNDRDVEKWKEDTNDVTRDYHGKSMVVMGFFHFPTAPYLEQRRQHFRSNWPSPIVWYQRQARNQQVVGAVGAENQNTIDLTEFQVFNPQLYPTYTFYEHFFRGFGELYATRKTASLASQEDETQVDCLAFQGTMKVRGRDGMQYDTVNGSGHHGLDYVGVSSVRAGKGYKMMGGLTNIVRQM
jgi:hypothetical protein